MALDTQSQASIRGGLWKMIWLHKRQVKLLNAFSTKIVVLPRFPIIKILGIQDGYLMEQLHASEAFIKLNDDMGRTEIHCSTSLMKKPEDERHHVQDMKASHPFPCQ
ncbi:hypothetical protein P7K49_024458 [Saguinus oedipus]|uniref:Uncharacterized protein n=1 Tax=Saguinus oedipus TaxID=9490 RepID=A0ABQ9URX5_SAGOE|nr:hypothetical protein P7K49_024458 [Saguinus oedipus]